MPRIMIGTSYLPIVQSRPEISTSPRPDAKVGDLGTSTIDCPSTLGSCPFCTTTTTATTIPAYTSLPSPTWVP